MCFVLQVKKEGTSLYPDALIFTLALCIRLSNNDKLRAAAYRELKIVCPKPRDLFLFVKFFKDLNSNTGKFFRLLITCVFFKIIRSLKQVPLSLK